MKCAAIIGILAMMCFFETGDAVNNAGTAALTRLTSTTTSTKNDLQRYGRKLITDLSLKLGNQKINALSSINGIVNPALNSIRSDIDVAKGNGKDAESCYEPARVALRQATIDAGNALEQCKKDGIASVNGVKSNIDSAVLQGQVILNELKTIALNCLSSNALDYQHCIIGQIPSASLKVKNFQTTADLLKNTGNSQSSSALTTGFSCNQGPLQTVRQAATDARVSASSCIASA